VQRDLEAQAECFDEGEVGVGFVSTHAVVDMHGGEPDTERIAWERVGLVKEKQQRDGVRAPGDGRADAVPGTDVRAAEDGRHCTSS